MSLEIANEDKTLENVCECGAWEHNSDLSVIRHDIWELKTTVNNLISLVAPIQQEISPMLEQLASSPLGKMLGLSNG